MSSNGKRAQFTPYTDMLCLVWFPVACLPHSRTINPHFATDQFPTFKKHAQLHTLLVFPWFPKAAAVLCRDLVTFEALGCGLARSHGEIQRV